MVVNEFTVNLCQALGVRNGRLALGHGRLSPRERDVLLLDLKEGRPRLVVSTGVDGGATERQGSSL